VAKKKSKDLQLAEIAYRQGWYDSNQSFPPSVYRGPSTVLTADIVEEGAARAVADWKRTTGGRKTQMPEHIELARRAWKKAGRPVDGILFQGHRYFFEPDGAYNVTKNLMASFATAK
jgi:hypothetical protein